jgi:hypothetical protein
MTDDREFWRATTDWLEAGSDRTPPPAIDAVLLAVRTTRQERVLPIPWRPNDMTLIGRAILAAAAVVAIAFALINFGPSNRGTVGGAPTPTPSPTPTPLPIPLGSSNPGPSLQAGARYVTVDPFPIRLTFVAPAGWAGNEGGPYAVWAGPARTGVSVSFQRGMTVYYDPCQPDSGPVPSGQTASDLVHAITARRWMAPSTPTSTTLGGRPATTFRLALDESIAGSLQTCTNGTYTLWKLPLGATEEFRIGMAERVWVLDTASGPLVVTSTGSRRCTTATSW